MKTNTCLVVFLCLVVGEAEQVLSDSPIFRRSVSNFASMVRCATGRAALLYNNYGCYCGWGGRGKIVDGVDRCCYFHDQCYYRLRKNGVCRKWHLYFKSYRSSCTICSRRNKGCSQYLCNCDSMAARCLKRASYNWKNRMINRTKVCKK